MNTIQEQIASAKNSKERKLIISQIRQYISKENKNHHSGYFTGLPVPDSFKDKILKIFRDDKHLVQIYNQDGHIRISVNRTEIDDDGNWLQGISWDTLMFIKKEVGYGDFDAVEVYPKEIDVVNVANIRHLFILKEPLDFIWRSKKGIEK
jgi:hypothetical protein